MKDLFPERPQDLSKLSAEELAELRTSLQARILEVKGRSPEVIGDTTMRDLLDQVTAAVASLDEINGEIAGREAAETKFEEELEKLTEGVTPPVAEEKAEEAVAEEPEVEVEVEVEAEVPVAEEAVVEAVAEPELVLAAGNQPAAKAPAPMPAAPEAEVIVVNEPRVALIAAAGLPGIAEDRELDKMGLADAMLKKRYQGSAMPPGFEEKVLIASAKWGDLYPEDRQLRGDYGDTEKIQNVVGPEALVASGGLCAPVTPYYELMNVAVATRPVRDALASFAAIRGGLNFAAPPTIADVTTGVGIKTEAQDAAGGTFATKTCQVVACPAFSTKELSMIYHCVQFGNLNSRAFPEQVAQFNELVLAAHARLAEMALLDGISSASTNLTTTAQYGAISSLISYWLRAAAQLRSSLRMDPNAKLRVLAPEWLPDLIASDLVNSQFVRFEYAREDIEALLERYGVNVTWYMDTNTGGGQILSSPSAGALAAFPTNAITYMFPEGSFLFLDGGTLDLGIVRDSTLNSTNDFQIFGETFENIAFVGPKSLKINATLCPSGTTGPTATAITC